MGTMNLLRRFSLICATALVLLSIALGFLITRIYKGNALENFKQNISQFVLAQVTADLAEKDFATPITVEQDKKFRKGMADIRDMPGVLMTVFYSTDGTAIWSDCKEVVGKRFPENRSLRFALQGKVEAVIESAAGEDYPCLRAATEVLALYTPVRFGDRSRVAGIVQIYQNIDPLRASIRRAETYVWGTLAAGFGVLYVLLFGIVRKGSRLIERSRRQLRESQQKIQSHRMELLGRIGTSVLRDSDVDTTLMEAAKDVCRLLGVPRCAVRLFGETERVVEHCEPGFPSLAALFPACPRLPESMDLYRIGQTVVVGDAREVPAMRDRPEEIGRARLGSYLGVPLRLSGNLIGVLFLDRAEPHDWTVDEVSSAEMIGRQIAIAIHHCLVFRDQQELAGRLLSLMNNVPGVVYRGLPDWSTPFIGADIERFVGFPATLFRDGVMTWKDLIYEDDMDAVKARIRAAVKAGEKVLRLEYRLRRRDGSICWVADRRQMMYDAADRLQYVDGLILDISDRKATEVALRLTQFSVDRSGDAAYWMGPDGSLLYVNEQACQVLGYTREELLSMRIQDINPNYPNEIWSSHWEDLRRRKTFTVESSHRAKDGRLIPVEVTANFIEFEGKEYNCASARDITERHRAQEESKSLQEQLLQLQKLEALGILAGGVAHDFNNLLTGILGYANLLKLKSEPGGEVSRAADVIQQSAEQASQLTAQLLGFARKGKNLAVVVDLHKIILDAASLLDRTLDKSIVIRKDLRAGAARVVGDPTQMHQIIMNLAVNASHAMAGGGTLTLWTEDASLDEAYSAAHHGAAPGRYVVAGVADTGVGIPKEHMEKIFDPFFTTKEQGKGTGLGLAMVFGIVKNHGGFIEVESRVGEGASFRVFLPLAEGVAEGKEAVTRDPEGNGASKRKGKILLIDDQEAVREVCSAMLATLGYDVVTASDGREGVECYRRLQDRIDLVIVDMVMPKLGGRDCFREIRKINPDARVILSSGYALEGAVQEVLSEGIFDFIPKPYRMEELSAVVSRAFVSDGKAEVG